MGRELRALVCAKLSLYGYSNHWFSFKRPQRSAAIYLNIFKLEITLPSVLFKLAIYFENFSIAESLNITFRRNRVPLFSNSSTW